MTVSRAPNKEKATSTQKNAQLFMFHCVFMMLFFMNASFTKHNVTVS